MKTTQQIFGKAALALALAATCGAVGAKAQPKVKVGLMLPSTGTYASRSLVMSGGAVAVACKALLPRLVKIGAHMLQVDQAQAEFRDGAIRVVLSESDVARIRPQLEQSGQEFNFAPAESGFSRLDVRVKTK